MIGLELKTERVVMETPRTDDAAYLPSLSGNVYEVVAADFARQLEQENNNLRRLLDKASQALACFVDLRGMSAAELKSAHNGICVLLEKTRMLDAIKAGVEEGD